MKHFTDRPREIIWIKWNWLPRPSKGGLCCSTPTSAATWLCPFPTSLSSLSSTNDHAMLYGVNCNISDIIMRTFFIYDFINCVRDLIWGKCIRPEFIVVAQTNPSTSQAQSPLIFSGDWARLLLRSVWATTMNSGLTIALQYVLYPSPFWTCWRRRCSSSMYFGILRTVQNTFQPDNQQKSVNTHFVTNTYIHVHAILRLFTQKINVWRQGCHRGWKDGKVQVVVN